MAKQVLSGFGLMNVRARPGALYFITFITIHGMVQRKLQCHLILVD